MIEKKIKWLRLLFISLILISSLISFVSAREYGEGIYGTDIYTGMYCGDGLCNNGETCSTCSMDCGVCDVGGEDNDGGGSSGGGSSKTTTPDYECIKNSDCSDNQYCFNHSCNDGECFSDEECNVLEGEQCHEYRCVKLFDIKIIEVENPITLGQEFELTYFLKGMANITDDIEVHFWIEKDKETITSGHDTIYIGSYEEKKDIVKLYLPTTTESGIYTLYAKVEYGKYEANAHRTIEIQVDEKTGIAEIVGNSKLNDLSICLLSILIGLATFIICLVFYLERKKIKNLMLQEEKWIKNHKITLFLTLFFGTIGLISYLFFKESILYWLRVVGEKLQEIYWINLIIQGILNNYLIFFGGILLIGVIFFVLKLFLKRRKNKRYGVSTKNNLNRDSYLNKVKRGLKRYGKR